MKLLRAIALSVAAALVLMAPAGALEAAHEFKPQWDQVANIRDAATRIGNLHRTRGAQAAFAFIDACYRTHSLAENYGQAFEACIAQDYLETMLVAEVYARLPRETFNKLGLPSPALLADSMGRRIVAAFSHYQVPAAYGEDLKKLVDVHGKPVLLQVVFPDAVRELDEKRKQQKKN